MQQTNISEIQSRDIYPVLPGISTDIEGLTALLMGDRGISDNYQLEVLCQTPHRQEKIYAMSRTPPDGSWPEHVEHIELIYCNHRKLS